MKKHSMFTKGCLAALVIFGSAMPVFAEPFPQPYGSHSQAIIDWEDEFVQEVGSTQMAMEQKSMADSKKSMANISSNIPVIDWEDEFIYDVPTNSQAGDSQVMKKENAASWDHEAWQSI